MLNDDAVAAGLNRLAAHDLLLSFDIEWSCDSLVQTATDWLLDSETPSKSMVGIFSSNEFQTLAASHVEDRRLVADTCLLLYATSQAHIKRLGTPDQVANATELSEAACFAGERVLANLDKMLSPQALARASKSTLQVVFLLVVAITLALGYTAQGQGPGRPIDQACSDDTIPEMDTSSNPLLLWEAMRKHVCEMLSHHLILIASKLNIKFEHSFQRTLITSALSQWDKRGRFIWLETPTCSSHTGQQVGGLTDHPAPRLVMENEMPIWTVNPELPQESAFSNNMTSVRLHFDKGFGPGNASVADAMGDFDPAPPAGGGSSSLWYPDQGLMLPELLGTTRPPPPLNIAQFEFPCKNISATTTADHFAPQLADNEVVELWILHREPLPGQSVGPRDKTKGGSMRSFIRCVNCQRMDMECVHPYATSRACTCCRRRMLKCSHSGMIPYPCTSFGEVLSVETPAVTMVQDYVKGE